MKRKSPLHVTCKPWPFELRPGERRRSLCRWVCRGDVRAAEFVNRRRSDLSAVLHPSTKRTGHWQVSKFDADGAVGDVVRTTCTSALADADIHPTLWRLKHVE